MVTSWTTEDRDDGARRVDRWEDVASRSWVPVSVASTQGVRFHAHVVGQAAGPLEVSTIASVPQHVTRTADHLRERGAERFFLNLPLAEGASVSQDGRTARLRPGDFAIVDSSRAFDLRFEQRFTQVSIALPHDALAARLLDPAAATARPVRGDTGVGAVASGAIRALASATLDRRSGSALASHLTGLIVLALGAVGPAPTSSRVLLRQAALDAIEAGLDDPSLTPDAVAARVGVSVRYLHDLFTDGGESVARTLRRRRLERAWELLAGVPDAEVGWVALSCGFEDPSHFARAFKAHHGVTPTQARALTS